MATNKKLNAVLKEVRFYAVTFLGIGCFILLTGYMQHKDEEARSQDIQAENASMTHHMKIDK